MGVATLEKKVKDSKTEISQAIEGQYADPGRTVEIKREKGSIYLGDKLIGTDGANEHDYAQEQGIKLDYSKLFEGLGSGVKKNVEEEAQVKELQQEERKGEMEVREIIKFVDDTFAEEMMRAGNRTNYEDKERFYRAIMFPEGGVWFRYQEATSALRHRNTNFNLNNMLN